jgi:hypothetical protein
MDDEMAQRPAQTPSGFQGSMGGLPLVDLLQVWSMNRVSGLVTIASGHQTGHLYFVDGEIVHAEADGLSGERAVQAIIGWPEGSFELAPNTTTLERSIEKTLSHLLLDAHRELDERRRSGTTAAPVRPPAVPAPAPRAKEPSRPDVLEKIRAIPGVTRLVRFGKDGRPAGDTSPQAEALAAKGLYLAMTHAACVAATFGLHDLGLASVQGEKEAFVVVHGQGSYLCVATNPAVATTDSIVAALRALLTRAGAR